MKPVPSNVEKRADEPSGVGKAVAAAVAVTTVASTAAPEEAAAFGPIKMTLTDPEYASVVCPPKTQARGRERERERERGREGERERESQVLRVHV